MTCEPVCCRTASAAEHTTCGRTPTYRTTRQNQGQRAPQVSGDDGGHGNPNHAAVHGVARPLEEPQVADQKGNLEEADAHLVDWSAGVVGARVGNEILLWAQQEGQPEAILGFWRATNMLGTESILGGEKKNARTDDAENRVDQGKHHRQDRHPVVRRQPMVLVPNPYPGAHNDHGKCGENGADCDDGPPFRYRVDLGRCVVDPNHFEEIGCGGCGGCGFPCVWWLMGIDR